MRTHSRLAGIVLALTLFSFVRGIYGLGDPSLWWDESLSHYRATKPFSFIVTNHIYIRSGTAEIPTIDNHPPLYFLLLRLAVLAAGDSEFSMRFPSVLYGVLIVPLLYQCGKRLFDPWSGLLASFLGSLSPLYLWYQQEARPYMLVTLLAVSSFYALLRLLDSRTSADTERRTARSSRGRTAWIGWGAAYVVLAAGMLATHYLSLGLLVAEGLILLSALGRSRRYLLWSLVLVSAIGMVALGWGLKAMPKITKVPGYEFLPLWTIVQDVFHASMVGLSADRLAFARWLGMGLFVCGGTVLLVNRQRALRQHALYLLWCFLLPIVEIFAVSFVRPAYMNIRHLIFVSPFHYLLIGAGVAQVRYLPWRRVYALVLAAVALGAVAVGMCVSTALYVKGQVSFKEDHRGWGRYLSEHVRPGDFVIINPSLNSELYFYYVKSAAPWAGLPLWGVRPEKNVERLQEIVTQYDRVWVAQSLTPHWADPQNLVLTWLEQNTVRIAFADFHSPSTFVRAHAFRLHPPVLDALPEVTAKPRLNLGDQVHLLGLDMPAGGIQAGHTLQLSLYWSAPQPLERSYRVTLALDDRAGFSWAAADYLPCNGTFSTDRWPAEQIVRDDIDLDVPAGVPPGRYRLNVSVYPEDKSGPALAAYGLSDDNLLGLIVPIGEVEVRPPDEQRNLFRHLPDEPYPPDKLAQDLPVVRLTARYGNVALLGHSYVGGTYRPGDVLSLSLYWKAFGTSRQDPTFSLRLVDQTGEVRANRTVSVCDAYPPSQWKKGEQVWSQYRFRIPVDVSPGEYRFELVPGGERPSRGVWPWHAGRTALGVLTVLSSAGDRIFDIPPMQYTLRANLDDKVELLGYDLVSRTVHPGEVVSCTLYWRALQEIGQNYTVFNHLIAADGQMGGQWDNAPQRGNMPTTRWAPGQVVADPYQIPVSAGAPIGPLQFRVGMYDRLTMIRLPVRDSDGAVAGDSILLTEIDVTAP